MNCEAFERWLDEGAPEARADAARAHADSCARCAASWRAVQELDELLGAVPLAAPPGFTDRVMQRVATRPIPILAPALPWWTRAAMEPAALLALALASLVLAVRERFGGLLEAVELIVGRGVAALTLPPSTLSSTAAIGLEVAALSLLALGAAPLFALSSRLAQRVPLTRS